MKTFIKALLLAMVLSLVLAVAAGCQDTPVPTEPTTDPTVTTDPVETPTDPAPTECAHTGGTATCTEKAICELCGEAYSELAEHSYEAVVTAPTCTEAGYTTYTCACGDTYTADEVVALGHTEVVDAAVAADCTNTGLTEGKHCSVCNTVTVAQEVVPAGHTWDNADATVKTCTVCGEHVNPDFAGGKGTEEAPYLIATAEQLMNISNYYETYKYYKVADGVATLDLTGVGKINLNGSFDGNGVKIVNLTTALFERVGYQNTVADIKISNLDVTMNALDGRAFVRNIFNAGKTTFENVALHGYIEGLYNMGSFYNYGTANYDGIGADYTVEFINAVSDITIVCTSGNIAGGFLGHSYEGAGKSFTMIIDEKSAFNGKILTTNGKGNLYFAMTSDYNNANNHFVINGEEVKFDNGHIPAAANVGKIAVVTPVVGENGYTVEPVEGATKLEVYFNAQVTAHDADGFVIANKNGLTWPLGHFDIAKLSEMGLIKSAVIVNGTDHEFGYAIEDGVLTIYSGRSASYESGKIYLQINQYDAEGELLATGTITVYTIEHNHTFVGLSCTTDGKCNCGTTKKAAGHTAGADATCTAAQTCTVCSVELAPAKGHSGTVKDANCTVCGAANPNYIALSIVGHQINGQWKTPADGSIYKTYDGKLSTNWNPCAEAQHRNDPGVIYNLSRTADLQKLTITFNNSKYYFDLYVSTDGVNFTFKASVNADNASKAYTDSVVDGTTYKVCTLDGLNLKDVTKIMIIISGRDANNQWVDIKEVAVSEEGTAGLDTSWMIPETAKIVAHGSLGSFHEKSPRPEDSSVGIAKSYDGNTTSTRWNPQTLGNYAGSPGVFYRLNKPVTLENVKFTFGSAVHYFDIYTSADGINYELLASVNAETASQYYDGYVCTIDGQNRENVTHIKVMLTGRAGNSTYWNFFEIEINK